MIAIITTLKLLLKHTLIPLHITFLTFFTICLFSCAHRNYAKSKPDSESKFDQLLSRYKELHWFDGTVLVTKKNRIVFSSAVGKPNQNYENNFTIETQLPFASITKPFTALAVMLLRDQGKIDIHQPISHYLSTYPPAIAKVTAAQLMNHSSGMDDFGAIARNADPNLSPLEFLKLIWNKPLLFNPGEDQAYSNAGYMLLGLIIESVAKMQYSDFMNQEIFEPLKLDSMGCGFPQTQLESYRFDFRRNQYTPVKAKDNPTRAYAAGCLYGSAFQLENLVRALASGKIVAPSTYKEMLKYEYGTSMHSNELGDQYGHSGGVLGFSTVFKHYLEDDMVIIVLSNNNHTDASTMAWRLAHIARGYEVALPVLRPKIAAVPPNIIEELVGIYKGAGNEEIKITRERDHLIVNDRKPLYPENFVQWFMNDREDLYRFRTSNLLEIINSRGEKMSYSK